MIRKEIEMKIIEQFVQKAMESPRKETIEIHGVIHNLYVNLTNVLILRGCCEDPEHEHFKTQSPEALVRGAIKQFADNLTDCCIKNCTENGLPYGTEGSGHNAELVKEILAELAKEQK